MIGTTSSAPRRQMTVLHLTASPCFGGVERQMLELGRELQDSCRSIFVSFQEEGRCTDFIDVGIKLGSEMHALQHDFPRVVATYRELLGFVPNAEADILCCHGYKSNVFGLRVARRLGIPIISVSHGWTGESRRVLIYESLDRFSLRWMDKVVCVSEGQAKKMRRAGVSNERVQVIWNAVRSERFSNPDYAYRERLELMFPARPKLIVGAAGRLSPEKGFKDLIDAAVLVLRAQPDAGFVLFGDGPLRQDLSSQIEARGLTGRFLLPGFSSDLDKYYPHLDLLVLPSYTEGLPNVVLEAFAAGVPVVATAVGGTPEIIEDGVNGYLVEPRDAGALAARIVDVLADNVRRQEMGLRGQTLVRERFSFASQGREYRNLMGLVLTSHAAPRRRGSSAPIGLASKR